MKSSKEIKRDLLKNWDKYKFHTAWMNDELSFPYQIKISRPANKVLLHQFPIVQEWQSDLSAVFNQDEAICIIYQEINYSSMGRQSMPIAIEFSQMESLSKYLGKWGNWQKFSQRYHFISMHYPALTEWLKKSPAQLVKYEQEWNRLLAVCQFFINNPKPDCYLRELSIASVDTKFMERHKGIIKSLLDILLPDSAINREFEKLSNHGFEKRYGLQYEQARIRFRLLDENIAADFLGLNDMEVSIDQFAQLNFPDLFCDHIYITENKINGLAFPQIKNALVIFGLGYGIQILKQVSWLKQCQISYWGDIDTHGFAILSQARAYFPQVNSFLMDQETLFFCKEHWGKEDKKIHPAEKLPNLSEAEQKIYHALKNNTWQETLRLEQEKIPYDYWIERLTIITK